MGGGEQGDRFSSAGYFSSIECCFSDLVTSACCLIISDDGTLDRENEMCQCCKFKEQKKGFPSFDHRVFSLIMWKKMKSI